MPLYYLSQLRLKRFILSLVIILICGSAINAQRTCGNEINALKEAHLNPDQVQKDMKFFDEWQKQRTEENRAAIPVTIPVHVIVVHDPSENIGQGFNVDMQRINSQIQVINNDFARTNVDALNTPSVFDAAATEISFCLATIDPMGNATNGVTRYATSIADDNFEDTEGDIIEATIWPPTRYLNIYLAPNLGGLLGYSSRPIPGNLPATNIDVVRVVTTAFGAAGFATQPAYDEGRTTTHEIGHWLGLRHVWGNGGCNSDDGFDDTPDQTAPNYTCPSHPSTSCGNDGDMFMNYMDYVDDNCMNSFSQEQADFMSFIVEGTRIQLLNSASTACVPNGFPIVNIASIEDVVCPGEQGGSVEISATSGIAPYTFSLNGGAVQPDGIFQNLSAGDYVVAVTETDGNTSDITFTIDEPEAFEFDNIVISESCSGQSAGVIQIETSGGNSAFPVLNVFGTNYSVTQKNLLEENFEEGFPVNWVADTEWNLGDAGSLSSYSFQFPPTSQFMAFNDDNEGETHVGGGSTYSSEVNLEGATSFKLIFDSYFFNGDFDGFDETAKLFLSENNGSTWTEILDLPGAQNSWVRYTLTITDWPTSTVKIRFAYDDGGGWNYGFAVDEIIIQDVNYGDFSNLVAGDYTISATDSEGCNYEENITISNTEPVSISNITIINANCATPGQLTTSATSVNGISEYQFNSISNATGVFQNIPVGTYDLIVLDNLGCSSSQIVEIQDDGQITLTLNSITDLSCSDSSDGAFEVGVSGAGGDVTFGLDGIVIGVNNLGVMSFTDLGPGSYTVDATDDNGCAAQLTVIINEVEQIIFTGVVTDVNCTGPGSISQSATGGTGSYTYTILGAQQTSFFDNLSAGTYIVTTMDSNGCIVENTFEVLDLSTGFDIVEIVSNCSGGSELEYMIELCSSDGTTAEWVIYDNQGIELLNVGTGDCVTVNLSSYLEAEQDDFFFGVEASAGVGCVSEYNGVAYHPIEFVLLADLPIKICEGALYSFDPTNNTEFSDIIVTDENGTEFEPISDLGIYALDAGNYSVSYLDINGCSGSLAVEVNQTANPIVEIEFQTDATSSTGGSIQLMSSSDVLMFFLNGESNDNGFFGDLPAGDYTATALNEDGCESEIDFTILLESSIEDIELSNNLVIYPNPTKENLFVELLGGQTIDQLSIYHADGRLISIDSDLAGLHEIHTADFDAGLYFVSVRSEGKLAYKRFIKF